MNIRVLAIGDIVGQPGRDIVKKKLSGLLKDYKIDFCVANGENSAGGSGITPVIAEELLANGVDVLTSGDHIWKRKEIFALLDKEPRILKPANYPARTPGYGYNIYKSKKGVSIGVANLQGRTFMVQQAESPFAEADKIVKDLSEKTKIIILDFHAEATSEKIALGWHLDGKISFLFGTHTHIQTADERVLPYGTAYITDVGMTGPYDSVIGRQKDKVLGAFITGMPHQFDVAEDDVKLCGAIATIDSDSGKASAIERLMVPF